MKRAKYVLLLLIVLIFIALGISILIPKVEKTGDSITTLSSLIQKDSIDDRINNKSINKIKNIRAITSENYYSSPTFSPDGKKIAMTESNLKGIYIENLVDGTKKKITDDNGAGFRFSWSPNSKAITYLLRKNINGQPINVIKIVEIENGKTFELTSPGIGASMPSFIQSNEVIYSYKGTLIKRKWSDGLIGNEEVIAENVPANIIIPSPKNDKLVIEDDNGMKVIDIDGKNKKTLVKNGENDFACDAKVSLDGSKVLYANTVGSKEHLFVYDIISETIIDLGIGYFGQWTPNGKVIYCITTNDGNVIVSSEIYIINADGSEKVEITNTPDQIEICPTVSPNGKSIAYRDDKSGILYSGILYKINQ